MPVVTVQLWEGRTLEHKRALVDAITRAMVECADADPSGLHVVLQEVPPENWGRAGVLGVDRGKIGGLRRGILWLSHLLLQVDSLGVAEHFYVDGLGFSVRKRDRLPDGRPLTVLAQGMGLTEGGPEPPGPVEHIAFRVRGVAAYKEKVEEAGGSVLAGPQPGAYGLSLYFEDPDGNKIEFHGD
jgi:4-oxalocrotonate tautomerase family enzyme